MQVTGKELLIPFVGILGLIAAFLLGASVADGRYLELTLVFGGILAITWTIVGQNVWWLPFFFFISLGGFFFIGFRIYANELAVLICLLPMILAVALRKRLLYAVMPIPRSMLLLFAYLAAHYIVLASFNQVSGEGGLGNITRRYAQAIVPFLMLVPFLWTANLRYLPWVLHLAALGTFIRFSIGLVFTLLERDQFFMVPIINFVPAGGLVGADLRVSGSMLATVVLCYFCLTKSFLLRAVLLGFLAVAVWGTFLGGGRITVVMLSGLFGFLFLIYRNYGALVAWGATMFLVILVLNLNPTMLHDLHPQAKRAASAFLFDREYAGQLAEVSLSDEWHARLQEAGWKSWTESLSTILVGRGVGRFEDRAWQEGEDFEGMVDMATQTSRFEKGLWDVLATFGLVGLVLYTLLLWKVISICTPILFRDRIETPIHAVMFIAVYSCLSWFLLCWQAGTFPSQQVLFGVVALAGAHYWEQLQKKSPPASKIRHFASDGLAEEHLHVAHVRKRVLGGRASRMGSG